MANNGYTRTISTADFTETPRFVLEQPTGDVHVEGWDRPEIQVAVDDEDELFDVEQAGSQVIVKNAPIGFGLKGKLESASGGLKDWGIDLERMSSRVERDVARSMRHLQRRLGPVNLELGRWAPGHDYNIKVPHNCDLTLRTSSGDLIIAHVSGNHLVQTSSGDLRAQDLSGNTLIKSASGDIDIRRLEGKLGISTASGDVGVREAGLDEISVHSASGDIELDLMRVPQHDFELKSVSGDIEVKLPADGRLTVEASTFSGDIDCALPYERQRRGPGRAITLIINGGGPPARFSTVSGNIDFVPGRSQSQQPQQTGAPTTDLSRPAQAPSAQETGDITRPEGYAARRQAELEILQAVERGELSPQEAVNRLAQLDGE